MGWALLAIRIALSCVFIAASVSKLLDIKASQKAIGDFGLPAWLARPLGIALPAAEILVAPLLFSVRGAWAGSVIALVLLASFSAAIVINMAFGRRPECHCFGQIHSEPIGWTTLARNGVLLLLAIFLASSLKTNSAVGVQALLQAFTAQEVFVGAVILLTTISIAALFWLVINLFRQNGRLLLRIEALESNRAPTPVPAKPVAQGLPIGSKAIPFDLPAVGDGKTSLEGFLRDRKPLLLVSTDPKCGPCNALMPDIANWQKMSAAEFNVVVLSRGSEKDTNAKAAEFKLTNVLLEGDEKIAEKYRAFGTPTGVLIRPDGTIGSPVMGGADGIRQLVTKKVWTETGLAGLMKDFAQPQPVSPRPVLPIGSHAPAFALPDLEGKILESANLNGNGTVIVFWNPTCGFCQRMLPRLKEWEKSASQAGPRLVLVSSGTHEANRVMGLSSTILIDDKFAVGQRYGASGTPSGMLVDKDGKIAVALVVGESAIMDVLTKAEPRTFVNSVTTAK